MLLIRPSVQSLLTLLLGLAGLTQSVIAWDPPAQVSVQEIQASTDKVMAMPALPITTKEDVFRIEVVGMEWDVGVMVYEPADASRIPVGKDGKKQGIFLLHGGTGDWRSLDQAAPPPKNVTPSCAA